MVWKLFWVTIIQESCLITRKPLRINVFSFLDLYCIDVSWFGNYLRWVIIQESCLITGKTLLIDVLSSIDLYYIDLSGFGNYFRWVKIQESCLITRKELLIDVLSFLDLYSIDLSGFGNYFMWAIIQIQNIDLGWLAIIFLVSDNTRKLSNHNNNTSNWCIIIPRPILNRS